MDWMSFIDGVLIGGIVCFFACRWFYRGLIKVIVIANHVTFKKFENEMNEKTHEINNLRHIVNAFKEELTGK